MSTPVLEVRHLCKTFPGRHTALSAVEDVSFSIAPGQCLGLVGESGSGKSTVARMVCRLLEPTSGQILLHGQDITGLTGRDLRAVYRQLQMVFQSPAESFDPRRTLGDGIGESLRVRGVPRRERERRTAALMERCGLDPALGARRPHEVSGGQCQRAAVARALAAEPVLLICDEATSALGMTVQRQIMDLLAELKEQDGIAILFICHDLALVQSFCDRTAVLHQGRIAEEGPTEQVLLHPCSKAAKALIDAAF